jgi:HEPN domain-containing protein
VVNRAEFQKLADLRAREAGVLLAARCYDGAYYLGGYAVECALKACIAKLTRRYDFPPPRVRVEGYYTHDLERLMRNAELEEDFAATRNGDPIRSQNWKIVADWSEQSRYARASRGQATDLHEAVTDPLHGILPWLKTRW